MTFTPVLNPASLLRPIIVVEDNDIDLDLCLQAFAKEGVTNPVYACRDGEEAVRFINQPPAAIEHNGPVLVLLDLRLPLINGLEVLSHLRKAPAWRLVPVVILSTSREKSDIDDAYGLGANSYLVKPIDFHSFSALVRAIKLYWLDTSEPPSRSKTSAAS